MPTSLGLVKMHKYVKQDWYKARQQGYYANNLAAYLFLIIQISVIICSCLFKLEYIQIKGLLLNNRCFEQRFCYGSTLHAILTAILHLFLILAQ